MSAPAIGELDEGPWWCSCLPEADPAELTVGAPLPVFRLAR
jgi:hypothetical protein